jgi:integrase
MPSVHIVRKANAKQPTWHVRMKAGRYDPIVHLGRFPQEGLARKRKQAAEAMLAAGLVPSRTVLDAQAEGSTMASVAQAWLASRLDIEPRTAKNYGHGVLEIATHWKTADPRSVTPASVQAWVAELATRMKPGTVRLRLGTLRQVLDYAGLDPNPARSRMVRRPKVKTKAKTLPNRQQLAELRSHLPAERQAIMDVLEYGGLRIAEATELRWAQVDNTRDRLVNVGTKTERPRVVARLAGQPAWVPVKPAGADPEARVFQTEAHQMLGVLRYRSKVLGLPHVTPHTLRHLHVSRLVDDIGKPGALAPVAIAHRMGHSIKVMWDTYAHLTPPDDDEGVEA